MPSAKGSCVCGDYTYEYTGNVWDVVICNCIPCRKYYNDRSVNLIVHESTYRKLSGTEVTATRKRDSGQDVVNHCCSKSLAVVWTDAKAMNPKMIIKAGTLDDAADRDRVTPVMEIFCRNRAAHFQPVPDVEHFEGGPPS